jgi:CO/xanthine dehydrogenase FAD-binding subunit
MQFDYVRPTDWAKALELLAQPGAVAKMGGCDVLTRYRRGKLDAKVLVGLNDLPGVGELTFSDDSSSVRIGSAVTLARLEHDEEFCLRWPVLGKVIASIASPSIRTSATAVGNIAQGWSVGDLVPMMEACDASLEIVGKSGNRQMSVSDYAAKAKTGSLAKGEIIAAITIPYHIDFRLEYERFGFKEGFDLPLVAAAVSAKVQQGRLRDVRIALVGASPMPARCIRAERLLDGTAMSGADFESCVEAVIDWAKPPSDHLASTEYRRHIVAVTLHRVLKKFTLD